MIFFYGLLLLLLDEENGQSRFSLPTNYSTPLPCHKTKFAPCAIQSVFHDYPADYNGYKFKFRSSCFSKHKTNFPLTT